MNKFYSSALVALMASASAMAANVSIAENDGVIAACDFNTETSTLKEGSERVLAEAPGNIGNLQNSDVLRYDLSSPGGVYSVTLSCASGQDREEPSRFSIYIDSRNVGSGEVQGVAGGWGTYNDYTIKDVVIEEGDFVFGIEINTAPINIKSITFTKTGELGSVAKYPTIPGSILASTYDKELSEVNDRLVVEGGGNLGNTANDDFLVYNLTNTEAGKYTIKVNAANGKEDREEPSKFSIYINGEEKGSGEFESKGWGTFYDVEVTEIEIPEGDFEFGVKVDLEPINLMSYTFELSGSQSGVSEVISATDAPAVYYNLQGVRVANPENGLYIRVEGGKSTKVMVK